MDPAPKDSVIMSDAATLARVTASDLWIQTASGRHFPLDHPDPAALDITDIAHALSLLCRFNGHCRHFYSVAEHAVHVSHEIAPAQALLGLLHDAAEAYLGDVPGPLKQLLPEFAAREEYLLHMILSRFDVTNIDHTELRRADLQLLVDEKAVLMGEMSRPWPEGAPPAKDPARIRCWSPDEAKRRFLARFAELARLSA